MPEAFKSFFVNSFQAALYNPKPITVPRPFKSTSSRSKHPLDVVSWIISINNEKLMPATIVFHIFFQPVTTGNKTPTGMKRIIFPRKFMPILPLRISFSNEISAWNGRNVIGVPISCSRLSIVIQRINAAETPSNIAEISFLLLISVYRWSSHRINSFSLRIYPNM